ncbi:MAG: glycosyltransferase family 4 protein [Bryobacteraceae bacterium]
MRILHIDTGREMRGGQHQVLLLMKGLRAAGCECILVARPGGPLRRAAENQGFPVRMARLKPIFEASGKADLVHAHDSRGHTLAALAARAPLVVSRRVAFPIRHSLASAWKYRRPARFIAISECVRRELRRAGVPGEKIDVVPDGVELGCEACSWKADGPVVALASRDPRKGRDLVEHAARISGRKVIFSEALVGDLAGASMFVYISSSEGLGSAALLAMSLGVPVIASRAGGLSEAVADGVSGILVDNDAEEVARAMCRLSGDPALARSLAEGAKARVAEFFSREKLVSGTLASYRRVLAG